MEPVTADDRSAICILRPHRPNELLLRTRLGLLFRRKARPSDQADVSPSIGRIPVGSAGDIQQIRNAHDAALAPARCSRHVAAIERPFTGIWAVDLLSFFRPDCDWTNSIVATKSDH